MENHTHTTNSDEPSPDFEFGSLTPPSLSQESFTENSLADHLFFNGRLLPHAFPAASNKYTKRSISLTTSEYTSRSNSTNSRSSSGSYNSSYSPRTSSCDGCNNNTPINHKPLDLNSLISRCDKTVNTTNKISYSLPQYKRRKSTEMVRSSLYRSYSSQRWLYITPVPVKMSGGIRIRIRVGGRKKKAPRVRKKTEGRRRNRVIKWWRKILMAAIFACRMSCIGGSLKDL